MSDPYLTKKDLFASAISFLTLCVFGTFSSGEGISEPSQEGFGLTTKSGRMSFFPWDYRGKGFNPEGAQWAVPIPTPKAPVTIGEYKRIGKNSIFDEEGEPVKLWRSANMLLLPGRFDEAEQKYLRALKLEPDFSHAAYQLACVYAMQEKPNKARKFFDRACSLGFSDYPLCYRDPYLGAVRTTDEFPSKLKVIRDRYLADASKLVGTPVIFYPESALPGDRLPVIFLLHGNSRTHEEHFEDAKHWAKLGFMAIALPGSAPYLYGGFMWSQENLEVTHEQIQSVLSDPMVSGKVNTKQVFLLGFSQGASHAFSVVILHPEKYEGAVPVSFGGGPRAKCEDFVLSNEFSRKIWFVYGEGETASIAYAKSWLVRFEESGWQWRETLHRGGHQFPENWNVVRTQVAEFLLKQE